MASLADIANQIKGLLEQIKTNTQTTASTAGAIKGDTASLNNKADTLINISQNGFINLSQGMAAMIGQQIITNARLEHQRQQIDTIICWLTGMSDLLCRILHRENTQVELQAEIEESIRFLRELNELVHGSEAVQVDHRWEIQGRLEKCCPPRKPEPEPCPERCPAPQRTELPNAPGFDPLGRINTGSVPQ